MVSLAEGLGSTEDRRINVAGKVIKISELATAAEGWRRRELTLTDASSQVKVNFWSEFADDVRVAIGDLVTLRNMRVGLFRGTKTINTTVETMMTMALALPVMENIVVDGISVDREIVTILSGARMITV